MAEMTLEELRTWIAGSEDFDGVHQRAEACITAAIKQHKQDAKDAARYRWLLRDVGSAVDLLIDADLMDTPAHEISDGIDSEMTKDSGR